jgi:hypothetical protein
MDEQERFYETLRSMANRPQLILFYLNDVYFTAPRGQLFKAPIAFYDYLIGMLDTGDED